MKKLVGIIVAILAIGVAYWLISPLFIDRQVDESLSPEVEDIVDQALDQLENGETEESADEEEFVSNLKEQLPDEAMMEEFKAEMELMESIETVEAMPEAPDQPSAIAAGSFVSVAHQGSGEVVALDLGADQGQIVRLVDLDVDNGPDLRLLLSPNADVQSSGDLGEYVELGKLKGNKGTQNYVVPEGVDVGDFQSVIVYCKPFHVVFNSANIFEIIEMPRPE